MNKYKSIDLSKVIDIDSWEVDSTEQGGSRSKKTVFEKDTDELYIFKQPKEGREAQIWSELLASYIAGDLLGWPVQHSAIATNNNKAGNLLGYIYDKKSEEFVQGESYCSKLDPKYDKKEGRRHTWDLINEIAKKEMSKIIAWRINYFQFWARTIAFDALISNTDRHAQNWAVILRSHESLSSSSGKYEIYATLQPAPFYDNATSMGCEHDAKGLEKWFDKGKIRPEKVESYIRKGRHHLRDGEQRFVFEDLCQRMLKEHPQTRPDFKAVANLDLTRLNPVLDDIMAMKGLPSEAQLSEKQAEVIMALLKEGQNRVKRSLGKQK